MANQRDYQPRQQQQQQQPYQPHPQNQQQQFQGNQGFQPRSNYYHNQGYGGGSSSRQNPPQNPYQSQQPSVVNSKLEETLTQFMQMSMANQKSNDAAIKNLETQVGQLAKQLAEQQTGPSFSANTQTNPKEHCKAIMTRSGRELGSENKKRVESEQREKEKEIEEEILEENVDGEVGEWSEGEEVEKNKNNGEVEKEKGVEMGKNTSDEVIREVVKKPRWKSARVAKGKEVVSATPIQNLPYPHAPSKRENERHYARFMDIFKQLQINIPFAEALEQMPKTLPKKEVDPGRVTLPVKIGDVYVGKGLIDLGSSINLIPLSIIKRLGNIEIKSIRMTLQLADKSTTHPHGIAQDVLVKVDKFFFPVDFIVIDMEEDDDAPLILGRPFMKTARMMIDVDDGLMKVRVQNEEVTFDLFEAMKHSKDRNDSFRIDVIEDAIMEVSKHIHEISPMELALDDSLEVFTVEEELALEECIKELDSLDDLQPWEVEEENLKKEVIDEKAPIELNMLPSTLKYVFLDETEAKPVIISNLLTNEEEARLIIVLKTNQEAMGWTLSDLKGFSPSYCMHKILMEEDFKPVAQPQRRLNPTMKEVVRKEVVELLDAGMIYPISDSPWVSPVHVVPKKGGLP
ncbi:hypothetical protein KIW84_015399 [Lathyrus oleraceus]|uniref:Uncharacterized protein n=1 Tax=Pisum sativum TaxID=3888 RepID=A0A9D5BQ74_PEA|nr:hypothetical protein KIW84_015399 [Pisum sativum]